MFGTAFIRNRRGHLIDQVSIPGARQANHLRKNGGQASTPHSMQCFIPPIVFGNTQAFDSWRVASHLRYFFLERHTLDDILDPLFYRTSMVQENRRLVGQIERGMRCPT